MSTIPPPPPAPNSGQPSYPAPAPQPSYGASAPGDGQKYNVLSIVSLVTAFVVSLAAVITGHIALSQIKRTGEKGRGLAIAGLILGYLGILAGIIGTIVVIAAIVAGASARVNDSGFTGLDPDSSQSTIEPAPSSDPDASGDEAKTESCSVMLDAVSDSASSLQENFSQLQSDPAAAVVALQQLSADFDSGLAQVTDPTVYDVGDTANTSLKAMIADIQALQADPTAGNATLLTDAQAVQTDFAAIDTVCG